MKEAMSDIMDEILAQEIVLSDKGFRPGFVVAGKQQFEILMREAKKKNMVMGFESKDGNMMLSGNLIVPDLNSKDRLDVMPESSIRTDILTRRDL